MEDNLILTAEPCCDTAPACDVCCDQNAPTINTNTIDPNSVGGTVCQPQEGAHENFAKLAAVLQDSVLYSWKLHLKARKYSVHMILEEYYDEALDMVDALIEHYQGVCNCDVIDLNIAPDMEKSNEPYTYFTDLKNYVLKFINFDNFCENSLEIKSDIDDILRLIDSTLYKLSHLTESNIKSFEEFVYESKIKEA
jgi:hypothetical protein